MLILDGPTLVVLIGPAGAGKSTWATDNFDRGEVVSSDALRAQTGRGEWDQDASGDAFEVLERIVEIRLDKRLTTVIDTLGYDQESRQRWTGLARAQGMSSVAVVFSTPADVCKDRNRARETPVPARVLDQQIKRRATVVAELPLDGFDRIEEPAVAHIPSAPFRDHVVAQGIRFDGCLCDPAQGVDL